MIWSGAWKAWWLMNALSKAIVFIIFLCGAFPGAAFAGGPIMVDTDGSGKAVLWQNGVVRIDLENDDRGTLGKLSNKDAIALVRDLFSGWQNVTLDGVSTVQLTLDEHDDLGSVDISNLNNHFTYCPAGQTCPTEDPPFVVGSARTGESPIIFDDDGSITDAIQGKGASQSILGFAGPRVVERMNGVLYITEGQAVLNGRFIDGISSPTNPEVDIEDFKGAIFHEIGHFIGLDHTQVNLGSVVKYLQGDKSEKAAIATMLPIFVDGVEQDSPYFDDIVTVSSLYPSLAFDRNYCRMDGTVMRADGKTPLQGVNVLAAKQADPLGETTSSVSGSFYTGTIQDCTAAFGGFSLQGLKPGTSYVLSIEPVSQAFTGGSSLEPCDPPQKGFSATTIQGVFSCAGGGEIITAGTQASTIVVTTKGSATAAGSGTTGGGTSPAHGGCSLVLF